MTTITIKRPGYRVEIAAGIATVYGAAGRFVVETASNTRHLERQRSERGDILREAGYPDIQAWEIG